MSNSRRRTFLPLFAALLSALAVAVTPAAAAAQGAQRAPSFCRVFNPLFEWQAGQERSLRAKDRPCDAAPGKRPG